MLEREPLQRLVLHTDGTMTDLIELLVGEPVDMRKLAHRSVAVRAATPTLAATPASASSSLSSSSLSSSSSPSSPSSPSPSSPSSLSASRPSASDVAALAIDPGATVIERRIALQGRHSGSVYVHAEMAIAGERLAPSLRQALATTEVPFGRLCRQYRLEAYKEAPVCTFGPAQRFAGALGIDPELSIHVRCYRTFVGGRPLAVIREAFAPVLWARALASGAASR